MPLPTFRFSLDKTGLNPDNLVTNEKHTLSSNAVRAIAPMYGAYFTESLKIFDDTTSQLLTKSQYQCVELVQDASLLYGKEICSLILITDTTVNDTVSIQYQVLGAHYQNDATSIIQMYETAMKDNRPVGWPNVINKPVAFNPALHYHLINDVIGFEFLVYAIDRIRTAIVEGDITSHDAIFEYIDLKCKGLKQELIDYFTNINMDADIMLEDEIYFRRDEFTLTAPEALQMFVSQELH